jgi:acylphosphatase
VTIRRRIVARGLVQGVGFRHAVWTRAASRGLAGFVRNLPDGRVEAAFEGDPGAVDALVEFCRRGPRGARVDAVEVVDEPPTGAHGFGA